MSYTIKTFVAETAPSSSADKKLTIALKEEGLSFTVVSGDSHLLAYCDAAIKTSGSIATVSSDIKAIFADKKLSTFGYSQVELVTMTSLSSWIPEHLYEKGRERQYLALVGNPQPGTTCYADYSDILKSYIIFSADSTAVSAIKIIFPGVKVRCQNSKLVIPEIVQGSDSALVVNARNGYCDIVASSNGHLLLSNSFDCPTIGDTIYKTLTVMKSFSMDNSTLSLWLCGNVDKDIYSVFAKYFPRVRLYTGRQFSFQNEEFRNLHTYKDVLVF